jgi:hypothetical protein
MEKILKFANNDGIVIIKADGGGDTVYFMYESHSLVCVFVVLITVECVFPVREDWILFFSFFFFD